MAYESSVVRDSDVTNDTPVGEGAPSVEAGSIVDRLRRAGERARQAVVIDLVMMHLAVDTGYRAVLRMGLPTKAGVSLTAQSFIEASGGAIEPEEHLSYLASGVQDLVIIGPDGEEPFGGVVAAAKAFSGRDDIASADEAMAALFTISSPPMLHLSALTSVTDQYRAEVLMTSGRTPADVEGR